MTTKIFLSRRNNNLKISMTKNNQGFSNILIVVIAAIVLVAAGGAVYYRSNIMNFLLDAEKREEQEAINELANNNAQNQFPAKEEPSIEDNLKKIPTAKETEDLVVIFKQLFSDKYSRVIEDINIDINKKDETHVWGSVKFVGEISGGWFLGYKDGANWIIVQDGNGTISCETIEPYDFSVEMVPECVDAGGRPITR